MVGVSVALRSVGYPTIIVKGDQRWWTGNTELVDRGCTGVLICVQTLEEAMADVAQSRIPGKPHKMGRSESLKVNDTATINSKSKSQLWLPKRVGGVEAARYFCERLWDGVRTVVTRR